ncbi:MAG: biopolymer transport protein ExbB [Pirellulaceae bacterium]|jgi:biopolymer transport protein ExbB
MITDKRQSQLHLARRLICLLLVVLVTATAPAIAFAQDGATGGEQKTMIDVIIGGGVIGGIIILLSVAAVGLMIEHAISIRKGALIPEIPLLEVEELIQNNEIENAVDCCDAAGEDCLATAVIHAALIRYQAAKFGFAEYKAAAEEAGEVYTSRLYRKTTGLALIAAIAPMLGLSGTVLGMIEAFNTIAATGGLAKPDELAGGIGKALITTLMGLFVAMPAMVAVSFFRNRIDSLVAEAGKRVEQILLPLSGNR